MGGGYVAQGGKGGHIRAAQCWAFCRHLLKSSMRKGLRKGDRRPLRAGWCGASCISHDSPICATKSQLRWISRPLGSTTSILPGVRPPSALRPLPDGKLGRQPKRRTAVCAGSPWGHDLRKGSQHRRLADWAVWGQNKTTVASGFLVVIRECTRDHWITIKQKEPF